MKGIEFNGNIPDDMLDDEFISELHKKGIWVKSMTITKDYTDFLTPENLKILYDIVDEKLFTMMGSHDVYNPKFDPIKIAYLRNKLGDMF